MELSDEIEIVAEPDESSSISVTDMLNHGTEFIQDNGWYLIILTLLGYYFWCKIFSSMYENWCSERESRKESVPEKKDEEHTINEKSRQAAIEKLQQLYNEQAAVYSEKMQEKEEKKRQEWLAKHSNNDAGHTLKDKLPKKEYNPLEGNGGPSYRPVRRSGCPGAGGCGGR